MEWNFVSLKQFCCLKNTDNVLQNPQNRKDKINLFNVGYNQQVTLATGAQQLGHVYYDSTSRVWSFDE